MANPEHLEEQREETRLIIEELLEDGSDPDALYTIEHHLSADDFETLEKVAVEAFKLGYEVTEPEELEVEEGDMVICCDILSECALNADLIDAQVEQLMTLAEKYDVEYDGWGTYYEDPNGEDGDDDDEEYVDEDDDGVRHEVADVVDGYGGASRRIARNFHGLPADTLPDYQLPALPDAAGVD